jgi:Na+-driven multidrug efflux pump
MRVGIIGLYLECIVNSLAFFFTAMQRSFVPMFIQLISLPVHLLGCYIFVNYFDMGLDGLALSLNITYALSLIAIYFVVKFSNDPIIH